jgi:hypothetical protein
MASIGMQTLSAVRVEGVRSAEPPKISGITDATAFKTSSERLRVATALASYSHIYIYIT